MSAAVTMSPAATELESLLSDQPAMPFKPHQIAAYEDEERRLTAIATGRDLEGAPAAWLPGDRGMAQRQRRNVAQMRERNAPKPIAGDKANRVYALVTQVIDQDVKPALLPREVMWRNPAGSVGAYNRGENHPVVKRTILAVKRALRALDPTNADPDFCSMERFRPTMATPGAAASFMPGATIPGNFAMTSVAREHWPLGEPTARTAVSEVLEREAREATAPPAPRARKAAKVRKARRPMTDAEKQALKDRFAAGRAAKQQQREQAAQAS